MSKSRSRKRKSEKQGFDKTIKKCNDSKIKVCNNSKINVNLKEENIENIQRNQNGELIFPDHPDFLPNRSPKEVLQAGAFGGGYFRKIKSGVTNEWHTDAWKEFPEDWFDGLKLSLHVANPTYDKLVNKYKVKCGLSLEGWESYGWIKRQDPFGWFQWYCRFYLGRRTVDDTRQISRWKKFLARFKANLVNKINRANAKYNDYTISPVIRQALLHWGYEVTPTDVENGKVVKKSELKTSNFSHILL
ncbi:uncharacterized protein LOC100211596 isoform X2 [Hydra vulgaris]|uniref:Uncharacterized protein LOC100211596 isoform X2 n=1 Tax=Hydra vulgaris TaxID=6087 RepID=A0ABM4B4T0_HYDVU